MNKAAFPSKFETGLWWTSPTVHDILLPKKGEYDMATCKMCGHRLRAGIAKYGARVLSCPRCGAPYIDPQIIELAAISERSREKHRLKYARQMDHKLNAVAALVISVALTMLVSNGAVHGIISLLLLTLCAFAAINVVAFVAKYYLIFPKLIKDSTKRMNDTWYLARMKACMPKAA